MYRIINERKIQTPHSIYLQLSEGAGFLGAVLIPATENKRHGNITPLGSSHFRTYPEIPMMTKPIEKVEQEEALPDSAEAGTPSGSNLEEFLNRYFLIKTPYGYMLGELDENGEPSFQERSDSSKDIDEEEVIFGGKYCC